MATVVVVGSYRPGPGESRSPSANLGAAVNAAPLVAPLVAPFFGGGSKAPRASPYAPGPGVSSAANALGLVDAATRPVRPGLADAARPRRSFPSNALGAAYDPGPGVGSSSGGSSRPGADPCPFGAGDPSSRRLRHPSCTASSFARRRASFARRSLAASGRSTSRGWTGGRPEGRGFELAASRTASSASTRRRASSTGGFGSGTSATAPASGGAVKNASERRDLWGRGRGRGRAARARTSVPVPRVPVPVPIVPVVIIVPVVPGDGRGLSAPVTGSGT